MRLQPSGGFAIGRSSGYIRAVLVKSTLQCASAGLPFRVERLSGKSKRSIWVQLPKDILNWAGIASLATFRARSRRSNEPAKKVKRQPDREEKRALCGISTIGLDSWTYYHNSIGWLLFFIRFNCVNETPSHSLLTVKETAEYLRIPLPTVYYLVQRGQIPAIQIGGRWRIKKSSLDRDILREDKQGQPTVLVVDDDLGIQELFKTFLKKTGFSRVVVGTAKEAISSLRKQKFDLMFLDLQLPDEPGDQVYKTAKQIDPGLNVIVVTGYPDSKVLDRILQISPVTVLKKPLKIEQLNQTVRMLGHKAALVEA